MTGLETVLADWREKASTLRSVRHAHDAELIDSICDEVARAAEEYLRFLDEKAAMIRSGKSAEWLRGRFEQWAADGHAEKRQGRRFYRAVVVPRRVDLEAAREAGLQGVHAYRRRRAS